MLVRKVLHVWSKVITKNRRLLAWALFAFKSVCGMLVKVAECFRSCYGSDCYAQQVSLCARVPASHIPPSAPFPFKGGSPRYPGRMVLLWIQHARAHSSLVSRAFHCSKRKHTSTRDKITMACLQDPILARCLRDIAKPSSYPSFRGIRSSLSS